MRKFLTVRNKAKIKTFLKGYLKEVLTEEECINTFSKALTEAKRTQLYGSKRIITPLLVSDYMRGLPVHVTYMTYSIVCLLLKVVTGSDEYNQMKNYSEEDIDLDDFYWNTLGEIVYEEGSHER